MKTAYDLARERFRALDRRLSRVAAKRPSPMRQALAIRPAADVPYQQAPISIFAPRPETPATVHEFVLRQFTPAARRLAR